MTHHPTVISTVINIFYISRCIFSPFPNTISATMTGLSSRTTKQLVERERRDKERARYLVNGNLNTHTPQCHTHTGGRN